MPLTLPNKNGTAILLLNVILCVPELSIIFPLNVLACNIFPDKLSPLKSQNLSADKSKNKYPCGIFTSCVSIIKPAGYVKSKFCSLIFAFNTI